MKLTIDQIPCDLDPSQRIALDYDAQDLADVRSGNEGHALRLRLPATRTNDRIFGFAAEPYTGQRFNAAQHTAVLSDGEAKLLQGSVRLLSAAYDSDKLTVGEFKDLCNSLIPKPKEEENDEIVYGLDGLAKIFGVSKNQAYRMKRSGKYKEAIKQEGQVIITNKKKALELFGNRK